jgi:hypothetical protein
MNAQPVALWGVFTSPTAASRVLHRLKVVGFGQRQIAIQKDFRQSWLASARSHAIYQRVPEGIVSGFLGGGLLGALGALVVSKGSLDLFPLVLLSAVCSVVGSVVGAITGLIYASLEPLVKDVLELEGADISIGVRCAGWEDEVRAKEIFQQAGGANITTEPVE